MEGFPDGVMSGGGHHVCIHAAVQSRKRQNAPTDCSDHEHVKARELPLPRFLLAAAVVLANEGQPASQFGAEVGFPSGNLNGLSGRFASEPAIQFLPGSLDVPTLLSDWHSIRGPSLRDGNRLPKKCCDLLPAFQEVGLCLRLVSLWHASTMLCDAVGLLRG